jgi:hypothetical protein
VAAIGICIQSVKIRDQAGAQGIEVDVAHQLQKVSFLLAKNRFVSVSEQTALSAMSPVETHRIPGEQPAHGGGDGGAAVSKQQVKVIRNQGPGIARCLGFGDDPGQSMKKIFTIFITAKD